MAHMIKVSEIIKMFKIPKPTTGEIDLTIFVDHKVKIDVPQEKEE